jgi:hypothetical protein
MSRSETGDFQRTHGGTEKVNRQAACERDASPELTSRPEPINRPRSSPSRLQSPGYASYRRVSSYFYLAFLGYVIVQCFAAWYDFVGYFNH